MSIVCLVSVVLAGCGGGGGSQTTVRSAVIRSASPLTFSVSRPPHEMTVRFTNLKAQTRGQVRVTLRESGTSLGYGGDDAAEVEPLDTNDPRKTVRFHDLTPGTYRLEVLDVDNTRITTDARGNLITVTVTQ